MSITVLTSQETGADSLIDINANFADLDTTKADSASPTFTGTVVLPSTTSIGNVSNTEISYLDGVTSALQTQIDAKGAGTVTAIGVTTANGVSGSSSGGATPNLTITLGAITPTTVNGNTFTTGTYTLTGQAGKTLTFNGSITLTGTDSQTYTFPSASATIVGLATTQTLTNKRITERVVTTTDDSTSVIDIDSTDTYQLSAVANNTEFTTTGTPTDGQKLIVRYKDAGVSKTLTWTFATALGITLPTATTAGKWGYVGFIYNSAASQWHAVATVTQA